MRDYAARPHYPSPAPIEASGGGGFRFAGMSHRGSILCLPSGIWAWPVTLPSEIDEATMSPVFAEAAYIKFALIGVGNARWAMPDALQWRFRDLKIGTEIARTRTAANTYNILLGEGRLVAAALIAVD